MARSAGGPSVKSPGGARERRARVPDGGDLMFADGPPAGAGMYLEARRGRPNLRQTSVPPVVRHEQRLRKTQHDCRILDSIA
jgi:hypothetical protein